MAREESKIFLTVGSAPLLSLAFGAMARVPEIDQIVVVVRSEDRDRARSLLPTVRQAVEIVAGGAERRDSAAAGVAAATGEIVLIHDGARPFPSRSLVEAVIEGAHLHGACVPVLPVADTLRRTGANGFLEGETIDRNGLMRMQTPQGFHKELIQRALLRAQADTPDDAAAVLALGERVATVPGEATNLKVTTPADLALAEAIASGWSEAS